ncbi:Ribosomal RNA methyltransferase RrmJ/FtsJ [Metarhizium rileyi]|nr:Ribosomal RNA methyltransferase RrmJ/FtsJ [Metarhizium rileyi RCEF 4871]
MGIAPGGFSASILNQHPSTMIKGITLPPTEGGYAVMLHHDNVHLELRDINMLAGDLGMSEIPHTHPEAKCLTTQRLLRPGEKYDLVLCGHHPSRNQERHAWRENSEAKRLTLAQLVIAMEHVKHNGSIVVLLHRPEAIHTASTMCLFSRFSSISVFKPRRAHAKRSSFYMVAQRVRPCSEAAIRTTRTWKDEWQAATLRAGDAEESEDPTCVEVQMLLGEFGDELVRLGSPVWSIQEQALQRAPFIKRW